MHEADASVVGASQPIASNSADAGASQPSTSNQADIGASQSSSSNQTDTGASQPSSSNPADAVSSRTSSVKETFHPIVIEVLELGRIPKQMKQPSTEEERKESALAKRLSNKRKVMTKEDLQRLDELRDGAQKKSKAGIDVVATQGLMEEVRALGRYPKDTENSTLARALRKARTAALFQPAEEAELDEMRWTTQRAEEEEAKKSQQTQKDREKAAELLAKVRSLGHYPNEQEDSALALALRKACAAELFSMLNRLSLTF